MAISHITAVGQFSTSATPTAPSVSVQAGDLICGVVLWRSGTVTLSSVTDGTNTYTLRDNPTTDVDGTRMAGFYTNSGGTGSVTVQANMSGSVDAHVIVHVARGVDTGTPLQFSEAQPQDIPGTGADAVRSSANGQTPSVDGCYFFAANGNAGYESGVTAGTDYTVAYNNVSLEDAWSEYYIQPTAAQKAGTFTSGSGSEACVTLMMAFAPATAGGPVEIPIPLGSFAVSGLAPAISVFDPAANTARIVIRKA